MDFISNAQIAIHVTDLARAREFYRDKLGFRLIDETAEQLVFETGRFRLYVNKDTVVLPFIPALEVRDYKAAREYLLNGGCEIVRDLPESKALYFRDPLGQLLDIKEANFFK